MNTAAATRQKIDPVVIVGGGLAGQRCAETLRRSGYDGAIRMVCSEAHRPYDRPPLSKQVLVGAVAEDAISYRPRGWYEEHGIDLLLGVSAAALWPRERRLALSTGAGLGYGRLLIATGSRPRALPLLDGYDNVSLLRTLDDATSLREALSQRPRLAIIGAGFVGQEVAASARKLGAEVTMIEASPSPLHGVLGRRLGDWFTALHRAEGVNVLTDCTVHRVEGAENVVTRLWLSDGRPVEADHVVVGIGVQRQTEWLAASGLATTAGVPVDNHGRTAVAGVMAAGDAAVTFDPGTGRHVAGSHWEAAARQGARAAHVMLGLDPGAAPVTSFWTDQYDLRIQYLGRSRPTDTLTIDGEPAARNFTATFTRGGRAVAALIVDRPRELPAIRNLITEGAT